jgi:ACT domain-containing protein
MPRLITHADISAIPDGEVLMLGPDDQLTPLAEERARARGIRLTRGAQAEDQAASRIAVEVTRQIMARLGRVDAGMPGFIEQVVAEVEAALLEGAPAAAPGSLDYCAAYIEQERMRARRRAVLSTTGRNKKGIVATLTQVIAELGGDILDISQTLVGDYFTMILVVDTAELSCSFVDFKAAIERTARDLAIHAVVLHEDVVTSLHRV